MTSILVIEDEQDLRDVLVYNLKQEGFDVLEAAGGHDGLRIARQERPDLVLLDLMLPDLPGTDVCRALRQDPATRRIPIVIATARGEEIDRVVGFELGADDYVTKPFSVRELVLRIRAILRRHEDPRPSTGVAEQGALRIDREAHRVWVAGDEIELTAVEFRLLLVLYDRRDRVQSREALLDVVWDGHERINARTVDAHVKRLRAKLGAARNYLETVRGIGYRFTTTS